MGKQILCRKPSQAQFFFKSALGSSVNPARIILQSLRTEFNALRLGFSTDALMKFRSTFSREFQNNSKGVLLALISGMSTISLAIEI